MQTLRIIVDAEGAVSVGVECVKGAKCHDVTREIERALGKTVADQLTSERYEVESAKTHH